AQEKAGEEDSYRQAVRRLIQAEELFDSEKYESAITKAEEAAELANDSPGILQRSAEILYRAGASKKSVPLFDKVVKLVPASAARNWQRGIALASVGDFKSGAAQFKIHHDVNPDDVENSAWYFLCVAKSQSLEAAKKTVIPSRGDGRQPMMSVLQMLKGEIEPDEVMKAAVKNTSGGASRKRAQFYADLYIGLYYDSLNKAKLAEKYLKQSLSYGDKGYMVDVARVYLSDRFPTAKVETDQ
ncbi:MAG: hypothetical protein AAF483_09305, partial [Planctomycetota bacterium]